MAHIPLLVTRNIFLQFFPIQKFMLGSLAGVLFTILKLGCKSNGLSSGQNLVFLVVACKLL